MAKPYENPLIPHARLRALYRGMVELRALTPRRSGLPRNMEACLAATAIGLEAKDLLSSSWDDGLLVHLSEIPARPGNQAPRPRDLKRERGAAFPGSALERMLCAVGAAIALKAAGEGAAVVAYLSANELTAADWRRVIRIAHELELPILLVALPGSLPAVRLPVPVIPVEATDAIALYRVAQESLVRARAGGGTAVLQCIATKADPVRALGEQLIAKRICTPGWIAGIAPAFARLQAATTPGQVH